MHASMAPELMAAAARLTKQWERHNERIGTGDGRHDIGLVKQQRPDDDNDDNHDSDVRPFHIGFVSTLFGETVRTSTSFTPRSTLLA